MKILDLMSSSLRLSIPLLFAAYGGLMSEKSGIANIALEAYLLVSAFAAAVTAHFTGSYLLALAAGVIASGVLGLIFALICVYGRGDQIVIGTAFNLLAAGSIPLVAKSVFDVSGSTPPLDLSQRIESFWPFVLLLALLTYFYQFLFSKTRHGMRIVAAGENPQALATLGVSYKRLRLRAVTEGALVAGLGGVYLSLCQGSGYSRDMAAGRGFIALAALIFGNWRPVPTMAACLFFGLADALQIQLQGQKVYGHMIPNQFIQIIPYVATLLVLVIFARNMTPPSSINRPD